jgi:hypothetical protein
MRYFTASDRPRPDVIGDVRTESSCRNIEMMPLDVLVPHSRNPRTHSKLQIRQIADSIRRFGFTNPVLVSDDGKVLAGHGRVEAAKLLGWNAIPTLRISHLSAAEQRAYVIADNRLAEKAGWDRELLAIELQALVDLEFEVELTGFELDDIVLITDQSSNAESKTGAARRDAKRSSGTVVSQPGDVWLLGNHRLVCGEADIADADTVLQQWEGRTGKQAILAESGQPLAEVVAKRAMPPPNATQPRIRASVEVQ